MPGFRLTDFIAFSFFVLAWLVYHFIVERAGKPGLNTMMNAYRLRWMLEMSEREVRIVDSAIMGSLQNGTAFFASTSLLAIGGSAALLRASDDAVRVFTDLPFGLSTDRGLWEIKAIGLLAIFAYAFFKFAWSYRLFNYSAILVGATPQKGSADAALRRRIALRAGEMGIVAGRHFTRGQRAFFFALAYLGWFAGPFVFMLTTAGVLIVMWRRQHASDARAVLEAARNDDEEAKAALAESGPPSGS